MGLEIKKYEGPIDGISPDDMWGDGFLDDNGWVAVVGSGNIDTSIPFKNKG